MIVGKLIEKANDGKLGRSGNSGKSGNDKEIDGKLLSKLSREMLIEKANDGKLGKSGNSGKSGSERVGKLHMFIARLFSLPSQQL